MSDLNNQMGDEQANSHVQRQQGVEASRLPPSHSSKGKLNGPTNNQKSLYKAKLQGEDIPQERIRQKRGNTQKINNDQLGGTKLKMNENIVRVKEEKFIVNTKENREILGGFEDEEFQNKQIKKFSINALIKEKDLIRESNYFDESHDGFNIKPSAQPNQVDFRISKIEGFETFQVKTFLFDRNLNNEIQNQKQQSKIY